MRIKSLELSGFRAFPKEQSFDLDADTIVVMGPNGQGKTSLFDGILWALTGKIARLGEKDENVVSMYSSSGSASAHLVLRNRQARNIGISRSTDGTNQLIRLTIDGESFEGSSAQNRILELLRPDVLLTTERESALSDAITRSIYLQQDVVRQFVDADTQQERFTAISELVGIGRVTELQLQLERQKTAWTRATNVLQSEVSPIRQRRADIEIQLGKLGRSSMVENERLKYEWKAWWQECNRFGVAADSSHSPLSPEVPLLLDATLKELAAIKRNRDRQLEFAQGLLADIQSQGPPPPDSSELRKELEFARLKTEELRRQLEEARNRASAERRRQVEASERHEELRTLARLALRHLEDVCPVCGQSYDTIRTKSRLQAFVGLPSLESNTGTADEVSRLATELETAEKEESEKVGSLQTVEQAMREEQLHLADRKQRLKELGIESDSPSDALETMIQTLSQDVSGLTQLLQAGEKLSLEVAQASEYARKSELEQEVERLRRQVEQSDKEIRARTATGDLAARILESLREATCDIVAERLHQIEPLLQRIYSRVDPHPAFRVVKFLTTTARGRGHLSPVIEDPLTQLTSELPSKVLSSSQVNALAVAIFLAFNLGVTSIPLATAMLDDPLQSLDDVNLLGLIDLLRRTRDERQLFISTHDKRFGDLLIRKLRPVSSEQRTRVVELEAWDRQGPSVSQYDTQRDTTSFRIVA